MRVRALSIIVAVSTAASAWFAGTDGTLPPIPDESGGLSSIVVSRISGADRYEVAVHIAQATRARAETVYLATGSDFPDALSAGPAVVHEKAALLLVPPGGLGPVVSAELASLVPTRIVIVGGVTSVPDSIISEVRSVLGGVAIVRISGANRYEVSRRLVASTFTSGAAGVMTATGAKFPDALSAGPVAARFDSPLLLVDGASVIADADTIATVAVLRPGWIGIAGGPASVSPGIQSSLSRLAAVTRFEGADRYAVSVAVNEGVLYDYETVYLATGTNFPDALAGGVLAGTSGHPLYVVPPDCVPTAILTRLAAHGTQKVVLLGGPASLSPAVERLTPC